MDCTGGSNGTTGRAGSIARPGVLVVDQIVAREATQHVVQPWRCVLRLLERKRDQKESVGEV